MFDLGIQELILIFVVALLVFGPKRLPEIARAIGKGIAEMKRSLDSVKTELDPEMKEIRELKDMNDPIALKNAIFRDENLIKSHDEPADPNIPEKTAAPSPEKKSSIKIKAVTSKIKPARKPGKTVKTAAKPKKVRKVNG